VSCRSDTLRSPTRPVQSTQDRAPGEQSAQRPRQSRPQVTAFTRPTSVSWSSAHEAVTRGRERNSLLLTNEPSKGLAQRFLGRQVEFDDLMQTGRAAFLEALARFDPDREARLWTFAWRRVAGAFGRCCSQQRAGTRVTGSHCRRGREGSQARGTPRTAVRSLADLAGSRRRPRPGTRSTCGADAARAVARLSESARRSGLSRRPRPRRSGQSSIRRNDTPRGTAQPLT
jgi:hypothetical protein